MKLVTFQVVTPVGRFARVGALHENAIVDLNLAYTRLLYQKGEAQPHRLADADMLEFLQGGPSSMQTARTAFGHVTAMSEEVRGLEEETVFYSTGAVGILSAADQPAHDP